MKVTAYEGVVESGCVHVLGGVTLPENARVYVVIPDVIEIDVPQVVHFLSPRLVNPEQADLFKMEVTGAVREDTDA